MRTLTVDLARDRGYPVHVGPGILTRAGALTNFLDADQAFLIYDRRLEGPKRILERSLMAAGWTVASAAIEVSERAKDYRKLFPLFSQMAQSELDRRAVVFALGGGVIGDLSGFVAGSYLRGIRWVGVPSTLLAQVDSSVGGKTGVNLPVGKNLVGLFHQPSAVFTDTALLDTLSDRDRVSGLGEILKCALTFDPKLYRFLETHRTDILRLEPAAILHAVTESIRWKAKIVSQDEKETRGRRRLLNFGHTVGHALETLTDYRRFRHGEAVLWGIRLETALSVVRGHLSETKFREIDGHVGSLALPSIPRGVTLGKISDVVRHDKKRERKKVPYVLLRSVGKTVIDDKIQEIHLIDAARLVGGGKCFP